MTTNDTTRTIGEVVSETTDRARETGRGILSSTEKAIDSRRQAAAEGLAGAAERLHARADHLPGVEKASSLAHGAASKMEATAEYLKNHDTEAMAANVMDFVRKHPGESLAVAAVVGFLAARAMRSD